MVIVGSYEDIWLLTFIILLNQMGSVESQVTWVGVFLSLSCAQTAGRAALLLVLRCFFVHHHGIVRPTIQGTSFTGTTRLYKVRQLKVCRTPQKT